MIVTPKIQRLDELTLDPNLEVEIGRYASNTGFESLTPGDPYVVYAVIVRENYPWYYIQDHVHSWYPWPYPSSAFTVEDARTSRFWSFEAGSPSSGYPPGGCSCRIAFPEWDDDFYYDRLFEGDAEALEVYQSYKRRMDLEFAFPSVAETATRLDPTWVMCSDCTESWEVDFDGEMVRCPSCERLWLRPEG